MTILDAVRNNAEWCEVMCRTHGHSGVFGKEAWTSPRRAPTLDPDAVTLLPDTDPAAILNLIDARPGCSIKDSYAQLDLSSAGFEPIIHAHWIYRTADCPAPPSPIPWSAVDTADGLAAWATAWNGGPTDLFRPELLDFPEVRVLAAHRDGAIVAGAVVKSQRTGHRGVEPLHRGRRPRGGLGRGRFDALRTTRGRVVRQNSSLSV